MQSTPSLLQPPRTDSFIHVLDWSITDLESIDRETRNILKKYYILNNDSDVTGLYLPRRDGEEVLSTLQTSIKIILWCTAAICETQRNNIFYSCKPTSTVNKLMRTPTNLLSKRSSRWRTSWRRKGSRRKSNNSPTKQCMVKIFNYSMNHTLIKIFQQRGYKIQDWRDRQKLPSAPSKSNRCNNKLREKTRT